MSKKCEVTSPRVATLAAEVLSDNKRPTRAEVKTLAASVLTQAPHHKKQKVAARPKHG